MNRYNDQKYKNIEKRNIVEISKNRIQMELTIT